MNLFKILNEYWVRVLLAIVAVISIFALASYLDKKGEAKGALKEEVRQIKNDLVIIEKVAEITEEVTSITTERKEEIRDRLSVVREARAREEAEVKVKTKPEDPERERLLSEVRMKSTWEAFCIVEPDDKDCLERYKENAK